MLRQFVSTCFKCSDINNLFYFLLGKFKLNDAVSFSTSEIIL